MYEVDNEMEMRNKSHCRPTVDAFQGIHKALTYSLKRFQESGIIETLEEQTLQIPFSQIGESNAF